MRIRKNQQFRAALLKEFGIENLPAHMCQLNQSPWDVMSFSDEEFQNEHNFDENGSSNGLVNVVKRRSVTLGDGKEMIAKKTRSEDNDIEIIEDNSEMTGNLCKKKRFNENEDTRIGGELKSQNGWDCKNHEPKEGHLEISLYAYNNINKEKGNDDEPSNISEPECTLITGANSSQARTKRNRSQQASNLTNIDEFYYYCWFGPRWGKRRGDRPEENKGTGWKDIDGAAGTSNNAIPSSALGRD